MKGYIDRRNATDRMIRKIISDNISDAEFRVELEETFLRLRRDINGMINLHNATNNPSVNKINNILIKEMELMLITKGILMDFSNDYNSYYSDPIPRVRQIGYNEDSVVPLIADLEDYNELLNRKSVIEESKKENCFIQGYPYNPSRNQRKHLGFMVVESNDYGRFISSIEGPMYISSEDLLRNPDKDVVNAINGEKDFVGDIIYVDDNIIRIRSKALYTGNYRGIEDYIFIRSNDESFANKILYELTDNFNTATMNWYRPRMNYLKKVRDSYKDRGYYDPDKLWDTEIRDVCLNIMNGRDRY